MKDSRIRISPLTPACRQAGLKSPISHLKSKNEKSVHKQRRIHFTPKNI